VPMRFFSLSRELFAVTIKKVVEVFEADPRLRDTEHDIGFGHEASTRATSKIAHRLHLPYERYYGTHSKYGNTVSAAVPLGMSLAFQEAVLKRGQNVLLIVGAAGITVGFASFTF
jgi:3-oxoacyl-[acyl-carrier-protein] synthase-3